MSNASVRPDDASAPIPAARGVSPEALGAARKPLPALLAHRSAVTTAIRTHFLRRGFVDVETPVRVATPALEDYIDAVPSGEAFLRTSPELHMKRLLAAGAERIFQLGPCFRAGEQGRRHLPEFTMLEWYRAHATYRDILEDTVALIRVVVAEVVGNGLIPCRGQDLDVFVDWETRTVDEAFRTFAGRAVDDCLADGTFEETLVEQVEPHLGRRTPTVLTHYPTAMSPLSRPLPENPARAERWELYMAGMELVNACSEQTDPIEQRRRFAETAALRRAEGRPAYDVDQAFLQCLETGLSLCAGAALGVDRLIMILLDAEHIDHVIPFPFG